MAIDFHNSLFLRVASALLLMPLTIAALVLGGWYFIAMMVLAILVAIKEWLFMTRASSASFTHIFLGIFYIAVCFAAYSYMRLYEHHGAGLAICLILSIWASDSGAYFAGKAIGGPKMAPSISPNKTWAGLIGGMICSTAALVGYVLYFGPCASRSGYDLTFPPGAPMWQVAILGAVITISGQIGDLLESHEKRIAGVKDSGTLIPGHGGLLDRIDALLLSSIVFLIGIKVLGL